MARLTVPQYIQTELYALRSSDDSSYKSERFRAVLRVAENVRMSREELVEVGRLLRQFVDDGASGFRGFSSNTVEMMVCRMIRQISEEIEEETPISV